MPKNILIKEYIMKNRLMRSKRSLLLACILGTSTLLAQERDLILKVKKDRKI